METKTVSPKKKVKKPTGEVFISREICKGCGICIEFCPKDVLELSGEYNSKGYHTPDVKFPDQCNGCNLCGLYCPDFAIYGQKFKKL